MSEQMLAEALALHKAGQHVEALARYEMILAQDPKNAQAHFLMGTLLHQSGKSAEALAPLQKAGKLDARNAHYDTMLALAALACGKADEAEAAVRKALVHKPNDAALQLQLAVTLDAQGKHAQVIAVCDAVLAAHKNLTGALVNKGTALRKLGRLDEARAAFDAALATGPGLEALNGLGQCYQREGKLNEAVLLFDKALQLQPGNNEVLFNKSIVLQDMARFDEAQIGLEQAARGGHVKAPQRLAEVLFLKGDFATAAAVYDSRLMADSEFHLAAKLPARWWQGEALAGKTLLIWGEQAIGEELMFASLIPEIAEKAAALVLVVEARMVPLFARAFPSAKVLARAPGVHDTLDVRRGIDFQVMMGSLMRYSAPRKNSAPMQGYFSADAQTTDACRQRYAKCGSGRRIGISWHSANSVTGFQRTMRLADWLPILRLPGAQFYSLQYGDFDEEIQALKQAHGIEVYKDEAIDPLKDMDAFAAQVAAMDLVISCANSTVHMAGALGLPAWVMTPRVPSWRWFMDREDSYWYAHVRLFRQQAPGEWDRVIENVAQELKSHD